MFKKKMKYYLFHVTNNKVRYSELRKVDERSNAT